MIVAAPAALVAVLLAGIGVSVLAALRAQAQARSERLMARLQRERDAALLEGVRRLGTAALRSAADVRREIDEAVRRLAPAVDSVLLFDDDGSDVICTYASGDRVAYFDGARVARGDLATLPARALRSGHRELRTAGERSFHPADAFAIAVPLARADGGVSALYAASPRAVDAATADAIAAFADHAAFAYALALEREADRQRAEYDALTGLLTPRAFRDRLAALLDRARPEPLARLALLFVDTDRFKQWNDTYGHASGDALLRAIARVLRDAVSGEELAARNGGDEFCLVFVDAEKSAAVGRAEGVRRAVAAIDFAALRPAGSGDDVRVSASIGVAAYPADASSAQALLEGADAAMYHVKSTGRDGVAYRGTGGGAVRNASATVTTS